MIDQPHWEHGYRCHGLWHDRDRIGFVGLTPRGFPVAYSWHYKQGCGTEPTLYRAKRRVWAAYQRQIAEREESER